MFLWISGSTRPTGLALLAGYFERTVTVMEMGNVGEGYKAKAFNGKSYKLSLSMNGQMKIESIPLALNG